MTKSRWRRLLFALLLATCGCLPHHAQAQALPTATGPGSSISIGGGVSGYKLDYGQRWLGGYEGWVDANLWWWGGIEAEARWLRYNQDLGTHATTYLIGPRLSRRMGLTEPYLKVLAGQGRFYFPYDYARGTYLTVAGGGGVDVHLTDRLQLRAIDLEYQRWPNFTYGTMNSIGLSVGVSYSIKGLRPR